MPLNASENQTVSAKDEFNAKTVRYSEWKAAYKRLTQTSFSAEEKLWLSFQKPLYRLREVALSLNVEFNPIMRKKLSAQNADGSVGLYQDQEKRGYFNGAALNFVMDRVYKSDKTLSQKEAAVQKQAFEQCQDYRADPAVKLKPLFKIKKQVAAKP